MNRFPRPAKSHAHARNGAGEIALIVAIGASLALAAFVADSFIVTKHQSVTDSFSALRKLPLQQQMTVAKAGKDDGELYTGSILYMPDTSNVCHQLLFDNQNGQFADNGYVDCNSAAYRGMDGPKSWSAARIQVIATGFRAR